MPLLVFLLEGTWDYEAVCYGVCAVKPLYQIFAKATLLTGAPMGVASERRWDKHGNNTQGQWSIGGGELTVQSHLNELDTNF